MLSTGRVSCLAITAMIFGTCILEHKCIAMDEPATKPSPEVMATFDIPSWGELLCIPMVHESKRGCFVVDTGCAITGLDEREFPRLENANSNFVIKTHGGDRSVSFFLPPTMNA